MTLESMSVRQNLWFVKKGSMEEKNQFYIHFFRDNIYVPHIKFGHYDQKISLVFVRLL